MALALAGAVPWSTLAVVLSSPTAKNALSQLATLVATAAHHVPVIGNQGSDTDYGISTTTVAAAIVVMVLLCVSWIIGATAGATAMWLWHHRQQLLGLCCGVLRPGNSSDIVSRWKGNWDDLAVYLAAGGTAAFIDAADRLDTSVEAIRQWYVAFQRSRTGPTIGGIS